MPQMPWPLVALFALVGLALPAMAATTDDPPPPASDGAAGPATQAGPRVYGIVLPLPLLVVYGEAGVRDIPLGNGQLQVELSGGYGWRSQAILQPETATATELVPSQDANVYGGTLFGRWTFMPGLSLRLGTSVTAGGPPQTGSYDPGLAGGASATVGPSLRYSTLNDTAFPSAGSLVEAGWHAGYHWGPESLAFQRAWVQGQHYLDLGADRTVAFRVIAQAGWPKLAWVDKFGSGAVTAVRGYQWGRFTGDRHVVATAEYRHLIWPKLVSLWGIDLGLGWNAFAEFGRAWESSGGVPFPTDLRPGAGVGAYATLNRSTVGGYALSVGTEGFNLIGFLGQAF